MNSTKILAALFLALTILLGLPATAAAAGPIDDSPPETIYIGEYVQQNLASALQNSNRPQDGPAPCLIVGDIVNFPDEIHIDGSLK